MKKNLLILILITFTLKGFSQELPIQVGIKTGVGISALMGAKDFKEDFNPNNVSHSLINGLTISVQPVSIFTLQTDILYTSRKYGRSYEVVFADSSTADFKSTNSYNYLSFSLLPGIKTKGKTSFIFNIGPTFNFLTSKSFSLKTNDHDYHTNYENVAFASKNTLDIGLVLEAGVQHKLFDFLDFKAGVRNETSLYNKVPNFQFDPLKFNTTNFYIGLIYVFDFNKVLEKE